MLDHLVDIVNMLLLFVELYIVSINILTPKYLGRDILLKYTSIIFLGLVAFISCINSIVIIMLVQYVGIIFFIHFLFKGTMKGKVLFSTFFMIVISLINEFLNTALLVAEKYLKIRKIYHNDSINYLLSILLTFGIVWTISRKNFLRYLKLVDLKYLVYFCILLCVNSFVIIANGCYLLDMRRPKREWILANSYFILVVGMFIQIALMLALIISRNVYREKEYLAAKYLEEQKLHYEYLENREKETRKFRHDLKNHLALMDDLLHKKQYETFEAYLRQMNKRIDRFSNKISVNNGIADAIVNKFYMEAEQKGITLHVKGHLPDPCNLSAFDLCTILSNLLSNAIEAEHAAAGNDVYVEFRYTDREIMLAVENDYKQDLEQENGVFFTTKEDKYNHGFGLENVKECVNKNNGQITIHTQNYIFKVLVCVDNGENVDENSDCR